MNFKHFDGMAWPVPDSPCGEVAWRLKYATVPLEMDDRLHAASIIEAYREIIYCSDDKRKLIIKRLRKT